MKIAIAVAALISSSIVVDKLICPLPYRPKSLILIGLCLAYFVAKLLYFAWIYPYCVSPVRHLPAPSQKPHWLLGHFKCLSNNPDLSILQDWVEEHGEDTPFIRAFALFNSERVIPVSEQALQEVLQTKSYSFIKPPFLTRSLVSVLGNGILFAEGDVHRHQRKLLMPAFKTSHVNRLVPIFLEESSRLQKLLEAKINGGDGIAKHQAEVEVTSLISSLTLDIIYRAGMGVTFNALEDPENELAVACQRVFNPGEHGTGLFFVLQVMIPWFKYLPFPKNRDIWRARLTIAKFARDIAEGRLAKFMAANGRDMDRELEGSFVGQKKDANILSVMLDEGDGQWTVDGIVDQLRTFLIAGHETTSVSTALALYLLAKHQDIQTRLRRELRTKFVGGYDTIKSYDDVESLKYLHNVVQEVLRFYPPVPETHRVPLEDIYICGQLIPKGTVIQIITPVANKGRRFWGEDARQFNPDRWDETQGHRAMSFLTFLQGPRSCIGKRFATFEMKCLLIALVGNFKFELKDGYQVQFRNRITFGIAGRLPLKVTHLEDWRRVDGDETDLKE
ncbi:cytochrome P450 [Lipomyces kononenkoae]|uniref:Cytochrome P450 n=1 Tax=Lipomyces kononenkoae TaxID=34357 RepID=A0ACC3T7P4_LIPKO